MEKVKKRKTNPRLAGKYDLDLILWGPRNTYVEHPHSCSPAHRSCSIHETRQGINKAWRKKKKRNQKKTVSLPTGKIIWCSWAFPLLETHSSSFSPNAGEGKQKWLLHRVASPKEEMTPMWSWFHFPSSSCSKCQREACSLLSPLTSSGSWHFPGKQYLC